MWRIGHWRAIVRCILYVQDFEEKLLNDPEQKSWNTDF